MFRLKGGRKHPQQEMIQVDTKNILFIVGGAFDGIEEIVKQRLGEKSSDLVKIIKQLMKTALTCKKSSQKIFKNLVLSLS